MFMVTKQVQAELTTPQTESLPVHNMEDHTQISSYTLLLMLRGLSYLY